MSFPRKNEEYMLRSIVQDDISGDNGMLGGGVKRMKCKKMDSKQTGIIKIKKKFCLVIIGGRKEKI